MPAPRLAGSLLLLLLLAPYAPLAAASPSPAGEGGWSRSCTVHIVAVSSGGGGVVANLTVTVRSPGRGRVYISTSPASEIDTQGSARLAALAASVAAGVDMSRYDFYYDIEAPSIIIGGPSAGAEMALATLTLLLGGECNRSVAATGMIQPDTSIGPVGGLREKLEAAARAGIRVFVVPRGQLVYTYYVTREVRRGPFVFVTREPVTVNLSSLGEQLGVHVYEAGSLLDLYRIAETGRPPRAGEAPAIPQPPEWLSQRVLEEANKTLGEAGRLLGMVSDSRLDWLVREARNFTNESLSLAKSDPYESLLLAGRALGAAAAAWWIQWSLQHELNATPWVGEAWNAVNESWMLLSNLSRRDPSSGGLPLLLDAARLTAEAAYMYRQGVSRLENESGHYYLPEGFFTIDVSGLLRLGSAYGTAKAAAGLLRLYNESSQRLGAPVPLDALRRLLPEIVATAKTSTAYLQTLLSEAGANASLAEPPLYLAGLLAGLNDTIPALGVGLGAIYLVSKAIHEAFNTPSDMALHGIRALLARYLNQTPNPGIELLASTSDPWRSGYALLQAWLLAAASNETSTPNPPPSTGGTGAPSSSAGKPRPGSPPAGAPQPAAPSPQTPTGGPGQAIPRDVALAVTILMVTIVTAAMIIDIRRG